MSVSVCLSVCVCVCLSVRDHITYQLITLNFLSLFFLFLYVFNIFFCHCSVCLSVCLVLWVSLPEIKIDNDDDDDIFGTTRPIFVHITYT